jgi:hypothetical protein
MRSLQTLRVIARFIGHDNSAARSRHRLSSSTISAMTLKVALIILLILVVSVGILIWNDGRDGSDPTLRQTLFAELRPVSLQHCKPHRYGEPNDGGYVMCENLLGKVKAAYSYGINGYDQWGCDLSTELKVTVHQYDCFNTHKPACPGGHATFHAECIGAESTIIDGRPFDTMENQIRKNGDAGGRIVMKIDVEGAEWDTFLQTRSDVLDLIDQLSVEFHIPRRPTRFGFMNTPRPEIAGEFITAIRKLKEHFFVANLHFNNYGCVDEFDPFPARAFEVLFVNKRLDEVNPSVKAPIPHPLDEPNTTSAADCQVVVSRWNDDLRGGSGLRQDD